jgi:hypothetical protein
MSTLPPDASNAPQPGEPEPDDSAVPSWAVPAVPPPWAGAGQTTPAPVEPAAQPPIEAAPLEPAAAAPSPAPAWAQPAPAPAPTPTTPPAWAQPAPAPQYGQPGYGQPQYGQPQYGQPQYGQAAAPQYAQPGYPQAGFPQPGWVGPAAAPVVATRPAFDRKKWLPTISVAVVIAATVLGGIGLDKVIAAPSAGKVNVGGTVTITAAPGWVEVDTGGGSSSGVVLQRANVRMVTVAQLTSSSAKELLASTEQELSGELKQIAFGDEQDGQISGHEVSMVGFEAMDSGAAGTMDGEVICMIDAGNGVVFLVVAPQGGLGQYSDDVKTMVSSVEVGQ